MAFPPLPEEFAEYGKRAFGAQRRSGALIVGSSVFAVAGGLGFWSTGLFQSLAVGVVFGLLVAVLLALSVRRSLAVRRRRPH